MVRFMFWMANSLIKIQELGSKWLRNLGLEGSYNSFSVYIYISKCKLQQFTFYGKSSSKNGKKIVVCRFEILVLETLQNLCFMFLFCIQQGDGMEEGNRLIKPKKDDFFSSSGIN